MKTLMGIVVAVFAVGIGATVALANPALLPKHEGYPMKNDGSPVNGQPTANDPGQTNLSGEKAILESQMKAPKNAEQHLVDGAQGRITSKENGAGRLPMVQGPQIMIEPPVKSATKISGDRVIQ